MEKDNIKNPNDNWDKGDVIIVAIIVFVGLFLISFIQLSMQSKSQDSFIEIVEINNQVVIPVEDNVELGEIELQQQVAVLIKSKDFSSCSQVDDNLYKKVCVNNIALNLAYEKLDITYCQKLDDELVSIDDCVSTVAFQGAIENNDITFCKDIIDDELQKDCEVSFYQQMSIIDENVALCDNLEEDLRVNCVNSYYLQTEFAVDLDNFACSKLIGDDLQSDCEIMKNAESNFSCSSLKSYEVSSYCQSRFGFY